MEKIKSLKNFKKDEVSSLATIKGGRHVTGQGDQCIDGKFMHYSKDICKNNGNVKYKNLVWTKLYC